MKDNKLIFNYKQDESSKNNNSITVTKNHTNPLFKVFNALTFKNKIHNNCSFTLDDLFK